jgi:hypothetical protein
VESRRLACTRLSRTVWNRQETARLKRKTDVALEHDSIFPTGHAPVKGIGRELDSESPSFQFSTVKCSGVEVGECSSVASVVPWRKRVKRKLILRTAGQ